MQPLIPENVNHILLLLDLNHFAHSIYCQTHISPSAICKICKKNTTQPYKNPLEDAPKSSLPLICTMVLNFLPLAKLIQPLSWPTTFRKSRGDLSLHKQCAVALNQWV